MAFWGVVLKPKKSFTLKFSDFQAPKLHLSQATLASRKSKERTIVRCRVADSPFIYVCSLLPGSVETCSLDLFFDDDVTFSVKGPSSVHLAGFFDGVFDGNESGEDVEDDGYSEEEEDDESDYDSMDDFIVKGDEDLLFDEDEDEDDEDWSSEDDDIRARNTGVTIEELPDDTETPEKSLVPVRGLLADSKHSEEDGSADVDKVTGKKGAQKHENGSNNTLDQFLQASSSEDEDGFRLSRKRKHKESANEQPLKKEHKQAACEHPSKKESADLQQTPEQATVAKGEHETDADTKGSSKKKKKKKRSKDSAEDVLASPTAQANGSTLTSLKQSGSSKKGGLGKEDSKSASTGSEGEDNKKGTLRKYPNGLEVENIKMGKPDGKQATPGKKIGMIYTGRLRSNDKIFDTNVGQKPFMFRLGVGEVIKGWDIGVNGMRVGDKRRLTIPPDMGYGSKGVAGIPPNSWLKFDVELVEVK